MTGAFSAPGPPRSRPVPPVRIVHLGLGAFARSHTAWFTAAASDADGWGIAAYSGRSRDLVDRLARQDGVYTLVERDEDGDRRSVIESIVRAHSGDELALLVRDLSAPQTAVVTLTITEVGYRLDPDDRPDVSDALVVRDLEELAEVCSGRRTMDEARPETALGRLVLGLEARRRVGAGPIAVVSCDNVPDNGGRLARGLTAWSHAASGVLEDWIAQNVSFVSTSVDRITPRLSDAEQAALGAALGDEAPVVAEPFRDWVLSGRFPAGSPDWESAGARIVDELEPWEARKLWLLNGAHTLLACMGLLRGHETVAEAIADPECRAAVEALWDDGQAALPDDLDVPAYRAALLVRFANPRIEHRLSQIAQDTRMKLGLRVTPVAEAARAAGRRADGCAGVFAAWIAAERAELLPGAAPDTGIPQLLEVVAPSLVDDDGFLADVASRVERLTPAGS